MPIPANANQSQTQLKTKWFWAASVIAGLASFIVVGQLTRHVFTVPPHPLRSTRRYKRR